MLFILEIRGDPDVPWQKDEVFVSSCKGMLYSNKINKCKHQKATSETGNRKGRKASEYLLVCLVSEEL